MSTHESISQTDFKSSVNSQVLPYINPRVFYDIESDGKKLGRVVFELFQDEVPRLAHDIRALFTGERGIGKQTGIPLHLRGTLFNQVIKGLGVQIDLNHEGITMNEKEIVQEGYFRRRHTAPWLLSFGGRGASSGGFPQLLATLRPTPHLDTRHVVVGQIVRGFDILQMMEVMPVDSNDRPLSHLSVSHCGELELQIPPNVIISGAVKRDAKKGTESDSSFDSASESASDSTSSEEVKRRDRRASRRKKDKKKSKSEKGSSKRSKRSRNTSRSPDFHTRDRSPSPDRKHRSRSPLSKRSHSRRHETPRSPSLYSRDHQRRRR